MVNTKLITPINLQLKWAGEVRCKEGDNPYQSFVTIHNLLKTVPIMSRDRLPQKKLRLP